MVDPVKKDPKIEAEPAAPPKQYQVTEEFVTHGGARYLKGSIITISEDDAKRAIEEGVVVEWVPAPDMQGHAKVASPMGTAPKTPVQHK